MRKGSALLIVLGIAAFLTVSAVSFAIYMRESRVPSSQLRRQVTTRYLLKGALANVIDELDRAIGDDPYPGVGPNATAASGANRWRHRVFTPGSASEVAETVPVLTLEALAYLPPAVVNDVRFQAQQTSAAGWHVLAYEFGRYAYVAVDVSDCFDLNRFTAASRRTSAPGGRLSAASLFRKQDGSFDDALADELEGLVANAGNIPFVSLADFNVASGKSTFSPFCSFVGSSGTSFGEDNELAVSNALFITDTWFPPTNRTQAVTTIDISKSQPFEDFAAGASVEDAVAEPGDAESKKLNNAIFERIGFTGLCCLYDYLDQDSVPVSFCLPTVETVPMVAGIGFEDTEQIKLKVGKIKELNGPYKKEEKDSNGSVIRSYTRQAVQWGITSLADDRAVVRVQAAYPFRRAKTKGYKTNFSGDVMLRVWWAPREIGSRLKAKSPLYPTKDDWNKDGLALKDGVITCIKKDQSLSFNKDEPTSEEAVGQFTAEIDLQSVAKMPLFWHIRDTTTDHGKSSTDEYCLLDGLKADKNLFRPYAADGEKADAAWQTLFDGAANEGPVQTGGANGLITPEKLSDARVSGDGLNLSKYTMHVAAWVRVRDGGQVVDLVPARIADDEKVLGSNWPEDFRDQYTEMFRGGEGAPVLEFRGDEERDLELKAAALESLEKKSSDHGETFGGVDCILCGDPRWNWAPENWFAAASDGGDGPTAKTWLEKAAKPLLGTRVDNTWRDSDVFLFTSDAEQLQSMGELSFLPFVGWGTDGGVEVLKNVIGSAPFNGEAVVRRSGPSACACANVFWRSYSTGAQSLYSFTGNSGTRFEIVNGEGGFRVNPFSPDPRILGAALRNTPFDYFIACNDKPANGRLDTQNMDMKKSMEYAFNSEGSVAVIEDDVMDDLVASFRDEMRARAASGKDWEDIFADRNLWFDGSKGDDQLSFLGVELDDPLYGVDRKYLMSFWRECFQNRQHLFLVFIRAEALSVGGVSGDAIANAQLGARGVALVWRDPAPSPQSGSQSGQDDLPPHRTRVLFYHQFD